jgi:hypothetical protein
MLGWGRIDESSMLNLGGLATSSRVREPFLTALLSKRSYEILSLLLFVLNYRDNHV